VGGASKEGLTPPHLCVSVCMCVCMCVCVCVCVHHACAYVFIRVFKYVHEYMCVYTCVCGTLSPATRSPPPPPDSRLQTAESKQQRADSIRGQQTVAPL
jgi:hypothetical protein